jgi:hypothetical protein
VSSASISAGSVLALTQHLVPEGAENAMHPVFGWTGDLR